DADDIGQALNGFLLRLSPERCCKCQQEPKKLHYRQNLSAILQDNNGCRGGLAVRQRYPRAGYAQLRRALFGVPVELEQRLAVLADDDLDVLPADGSCEIVPGECLVGRLLRGEAGRVVARGVRVPARVVDLPKREQSLEGSFLVDGDHA